MNPFSLTEASLAPSSICPGSSYTSGSHCLWHIHLGQREQRGYSVKWCLIDVAHESNKVILLLLNRISINQAENFSYTKVFLYDANRLLANRSYFIMNKFEHNQGVPVRGGARFGPGGSCTEGVGAGAGLGVDVGRGDGVPVQSGPSWTSLNMPRGSLYGEVQCIMGNDHMGPPVDRQTHRRLKTFHSLLRWQAVTRMTWKVIEYTYLVAWDIWRIEAHTHGLSTASLVSY